MNDSKKNNKSVVFPSVVPSPMPYMRTVKELAEESRGFGISETHIRKALKKGEIPYITVGRKILINRDRFIDYLNGEAVKKE